MSEPIFPIKCSTDMLGHPWEFTHTWLENNVHLQRQFDKGLWDLLTFIQDAWQTDIVDTSHWMAHCFAIRNQPHLYFRFVRRHWQKPILALSAQMYTSSYLWTRLMTQSWYEITQACVMPAKAGIQDVS